VHRCIERRREESVHIRRIECIMYGTGLGGARAASISACVLGPWHLSRPVASEGFLRTRVAGVVNNKQRLRQ
jgi:hypothetical protein